MPIANSLDLKLSPNPSVSFIDLDIHSDLPTALLRITNNRGDMVFEEDISISKKLKLRLNVDNFHPGTYYVSLSSGKEIISRQFLKE